MATKFERAMDLLNDVEEDTRKDQTADILDTLRGYLKHHADDEETAGLLSAIEVVESNYIF